jgi:catechol 2,3-dioxygenase-like lactoylglutathione lyase family enzyme
MDLGVFSLSLNVTDLEASREFYSKLGFTDFGGDASQGWLILKHDSLLLGLFVGMFDRPMLTFNPGWTAEATEYDPFTDVRVVQSTLRERGITFDSEADELTTGPASFVITDPDGNPILVDQHR